MAEFTQSQKLHNVLYDIRGPLLEHAQRMEAAGQRILKLNIGNPAPFGFEAPEAILVDMIRHLPTAQGYSDSRGIFSARTAVVQYYQGRGIQNIDVDDVYLGNGVSELITMSLQALLDTATKSWCPPRTIRCGRPRSRWPAAPPCTTSATRTTTGGRTSRTWKSGSRRGPRALCSSTRTTPPAPCTPSTCSARSWTWPASTT